MTGRPGKRRLLRIPSDVERFLEALGVSCLISDAAPRPDRGCRAGGSRAPACRCLGHGRHCRGMLSAPLRRGETQRQSRQKLLPGHGQCLSLREGYRGPGVPGGTAKPSPAGPAGRPRSVLCPWPGGRPGPVEALGYAVAGGPVRGRARHSPSMSLVTVLKCIFCGRQPGRAGALWPPRRSSSAPFPACSAAATEIREAILKAFALGDRGLFSSIGETPMQEQQARQPPTTSPPLPPPHSPPFYRTIQGGANETPSFQTGGWRRET